MKSDFRAVAVSSSKDEPFSAFISKPPLSAQYIGNRSSASFFAAAVVNQQILPEDPVRNAVIPLSAPDPEFSAFMLDVMSAVSKGENASGLTRAYIEVVIKGKDLKADEEACEILDEYVFNNIIYDLGLLYGGADAVLTGLVSSKSIDVISALDASRDSIQSKIDEVVSLYESN